jgi:ABC-2 type transport system permease protein
MKKVLLIIQREYVTRVRKKAFIVMIFVVPLLLGMSSLSLCC